jgi:hypothetical protein
MGDAEFVVARILGDEVRAERYECEVRSWHTAPVPEEGRGKGLREIAADLVVWCAGDEGARRAGRALCERAGEKAPGFLEVTGWADAPLAELLRSVRPAGEAAEAGPGRADSGEVEVSELRSAEEASAQESAERAAAAAEPRSEGERGGGDGDMVRRLSLVLAARAKRRDAA